MDNLWQVIQISMPNNYKKYEVFWKFITIVKISLKFKPLMITCIDYLIFIWKQLDNNG